MLYENERNLEGIKARIEKDLDRDETILKAWKDVTFPTKKDGSEFAVMSKNFEGATYRKQEYALQPGENELHVARRSEKTAAYYDDTISLYDSVQARDLEKVEKKENLKKSTSAYLCSVYSYDLADAKTAVAKRIAYYENLVETDEKNLEEVEKAYKVFLDSFTTALENLEEVAGNKSLVDLVAGTVCQNFPYCK